MTIVVIYIGYSDAYHKYDTMNLVLQFDHHPYQSSCQSAEWNLCEEAVVSTYPGIWSFTGEFFAFSLAEPEEDYLNTFNIEGIRSRSLFIFRETVEPSRPNWMDYLKEQKITSHQIQDSKYSTFLIIFITSSSVVISPG